MVGCNSFDRMNLVDTPMWDSIHSPQSVVDLLITVPALIVIPLDEDRTMIMLGQFDPNALNRGGRQAGPVVMIATRKSRLENRKFPGKCSPNDCSRHRARIHAVGHSEHQ